MSPGDHLAGEEAALLHQMSFEQIVGESCDRLWDKKVRHAIQRIQELESALNAIEADLDKLIRDRLPAQEPPG